MTKSLICTLIAVVTVIMSYLCVELVIIDLL